MLLNLFDRNSPPANAVALLTVRAQLPLVKVSVTVLAFRPHVAEDGLDVALRTRNIAVHTAQRISSLIVVELRNSPDWLPALSSMAILTGNAQRAVRVVSTRGILRRPAGQRNEKQQK